MKFKIVYFCQKIYLKFQKKNRFQFHIHQRYIYPTVIYPMGEPLLGDRFISKKQKLISNEYISTEIIPPI